MLVTPPRSLSPSKVTAFTDCPLAFRFVAIDRLPELPSPPATKGTLVHSALENLFWSRRPGQRTLETALEELDAAWQQLQEDTEFKSLGLNTQAAFEFRADAELLVRNYFALEDPNDVQAIGVELRLEADIGGVRLRGIIDRLDLAPDGSLVVVDYKTGRAPSAGYEQGKLKGVQFYADLCERVLGQPPSAIRLLHLREPVMITAHPNSQSLRGHRQRTTAVWSAIERACGTGDFRPRPSHLCNFCSFQPLCPAHGGTPPPIPTDGSADGSHRAPLEPSSAPLGTAVRLMPASARFDRAPAPADSAPADTAPASLDTAPAAVEVSAASPN